MAVVQYLDADLERDMAAPAAQAFPVLALELDSGPVFLAGHRATLGDDVLHPALLTVGEVTADGFSATVEQQALPAYADGWWINRAAAFLECTPAMQSVYDGAIRFDGIVAAEPVEQGGVLSFAVVPRRKTVRTLPGLGLVTASEWPLAADSAMGAAKPMIFGSVDECPLLPVQVQPWTTLAAAALPDSAQLEVADASRLAASGSVVVDGITYAYTHRSDNALLGMSIPRGHPAGTLVAQAGANVYLAAGHAVSSIADIRADGTRVDGATVNLSAATVSFAAPPAVPVSTTRYTLTEHFDAVAAGNTATSAVNAIRAAINTYTHTGTASGTVTAAAPGTISFIRPVDGNRIISGAYSVTFSVAVGAQVGWAHVKIGNDVVWAYDPGVGVVFNGSPAAVLRDDDADVLPVTVEVAEGGTDNQVTVTILSATRVVVTGNLDEANFATVAPNTVLKVTQTGTPPDRGRIAKAMLVVRWFTTDETIGTTQVKFGGRVLGKLAMTANSKQTLSQTVSVNSVTQGSASFPTTAISTSASKTDSAVSAPVNAPIGYTFARISTSDSRYCMLYPIDVEIALPPNVVAGTYTFTLQLQAAPLNPASYSQASFEIGGTSGSVNTGYPTSISLNVAISDNQSSLRVRHGEWNVLNQFTTAWLSMATMPTIKYLSGSVNCKPTKDAISVSASSSSLSSANLTNSGIAVSLSNNAISLTVPAPPRVVDTVFDLAGFTDWAQFANQTAEISLTGAGASVAVVETYLAIEFDEIAYAPASQITATVGGYSGNPADVIATLIAASGDTTAPDDQRRLRAWAVAESCVFARRLSESTDALTLLTYAAEQAGCALYATDAGLAMRRWADRHGDITAISDSDLIEMPSVGWAERVETDITLRYRDDYAGGAGMTRVAQATAATDATCAQAEIDLRDTRPVAIDGGWIRDDATAATLLAATVDRYARLRRAADLRLPYAFGAIESGSMIDWRSRLWRVEGVAHESGWVGLRVEELAT